MLPNLLVIGAAKCGTTSLHEYLDAHPEIGNFEYRIPIFGPVALAAFADIGTVSFGRNDSVGLTVLLCLLTINAINFIDGLDGLKRRQFLLEPLDVGRFEGDAGGRQRALAHGREHVQLVLDLLRGQEHALDVGADVGEVHEEV